MADEKNLFKIPEWAGKPPHGTHLDVKKNESVIQKLLVDEKGHYYFGRNPNQCDFITEHASSSRVHGVLLYHTLLKKFALVDLKSSHGTFVKGIRIAPLQPVFLDFDDPFHFGASTRRYVLRSRLSSALDGETSSFHHGDDLNYTLPDQEHELENLTNYNTMQNRRIQTIPITLEEARRKTRPRGNVSFLEEEDIINPEDIDPTVGRFRNLIQTAVVGNTKRKSVPSETKEQKRRKVFLPGKDDGEIAPSYSSVLGNVSLCAAPNLDLYAGIHLTAMNATMKPPGTVSATTSFQSTEEDTSKKKYAKEAWPGRKPVHTVI